MTKGFPDSPPRGKRLEVEEQLIIRQYNGPIPPASELQQLKAVDPAFPERVMRMAEAHAQADVRRKDRFSLSPILGQVASFLLSCMGFGIGVLFAFKGIEVGAITAIISGIVPIVIAALSNLNRK
jgi:uncharacterized membrane protein